MATKKAKQEGQATPKPKQAAPPPSSFRWFFGHIFSLLRRHGNFVAGCGLIGYCFHQGSLALIAFAGHQSIADLKLGVLANVSVVFTFSMAVSGASIGLYLRERGKHLETRERLSARTKELELKLDPIRTSSNLTSQGLTRKEDA